MYKIIALLSLLLPSLVQAQDLSSKVKPSLKNRMTVEQARIKCANLSPEKNLDLPKFVRRWKIFLKKLKSKKNILLSH